MFGVEKSMFIHMSSMYGYFGDLLAFGFTHVRPPQHTIIIWEEKKIEFSHSKAQVIIMIKYLCNTGEGLSPMFSTLHL